MAPSLKHQFNNAIPDDPVAQAAGETLPSHWNAEHDLILATGMLVGRTTAGTGAAEEIPIADFATAAQGALADSALQASAIIDSIADADTTHAPSRNAVFDALALKANTADVPNPVLFACNSSATALADVNTVQALFPAGFDALTVEADTTYYFEGSFRVTNGTTGHTDAFGFGGTATFTSIAYMAEGGKHAAGSINGVNQLWVTTAAMTVISAGGTTTGAALRVRGVMRINAGGTVIPQWQFNNAPGGTNQVEANSYIRFQKMGTGSVTSNGAWA